MAFIHSRTISEFAVNCGLAEDHQDFLAQWVRLTGVERDEWAALAKENGYN